MKKQLLMAGLLFAGVLSANAQVFQSDNFDALTVGNLTTDVTGATAGQGTWYAGASSGATVANFQIVTEGTGKALQIQSPSVAPGATSVTRFVWKGDGITWSSKTAGNNVLRLEVDLHTGAATTSKTFYALNVYNAEGRSVGGFQYSPDTRGLIGVMLKSATEVTGIALDEVNGQPAAVTLPQNQWVKLILMINYNNGTVTWSIPSMPDKGGSSNPTAWYTTANQPKEFNFVAGASAGNNAAATLKFDNYSLSAVASETASVNDQLSQQFAMYPNPTTGLVTITNNENVFVNQVNVTDMNGRVVKTLTFDNVSEAQVDMSNLSAGMYILNIDTNQGTATKKVIKK